MHAHQGRTQRGGVGVKTPLELDILQNFITCAKEIQRRLIVFAYFLLVHLST